VRFIAVWVDLFRVFGHRLGVTLNPLELLVYGQVAQPQVMGFRVARGHKQ
jgi:hypothetical protein